MTDDPPRWTFEGWPDELQDEVERVFREASERRREEERRRESELERRPLAPINVDDFRIEVL